MIVVSPTVSRVDLFSVTIANARILVVLHVVPCVREKIRYAGQWWVFEKGSKSRENLPVAVKKAW